MHNRSDTYRAPAPTQPPNSSSSIAHIFGVPLPAAQRFSAAGFPLPSSSALALAQFSVPACGDWNMPVRHWTESAQQQQQQSQQSRVPDSRQAPAPGGLHTLTRGEGVALTTSGERGVYLGRPIMAQYGNVVFCLMRDSSTSPPSARVLSVDLRAASDMLLFLPCETCDMCMQLVPIDETVVHAQLIHGRMMPLNNSNNNIHGTTVNLAQLGNSHAPSLYSTPSSGAAAAATGAATVRAAGSASASPTVPQTAALPLPPPSSSSQPSAPLSSYLTANRTYVAGDAQLMSHLKRTKKLGEGAQGIVWQCLVEPASRAPRIDPRACPAATPGSLVLKTIKCKDAAAAAARFEQSVRLMQITSTHLVPYFAVVYDPRQSEDGHPLVHVVMPFYGGGNLMTQIAKQQGKFSESWLLSTMLQLANALNVLHSQRIVHGDVKPDNILLFGDNQVLLMDLEASSVLPPGEASVKADNEGTYEWRAPECDKCVVSTASDMWSLGVVAVVLALLPDYPALKNPDSGCEELLHAASWTDSRLYWSVKDAVAARGYGDRTAEIICSLLRVDPKNRPTTTTLNEVLTQWMEKLIFAGQF